MTDYLDDFIPIDSAYLDSSDADFSANDEFSYDKDGYIIECD